MESQMKYLATLLAALAALTLTACDEIGSGKITVGDADGDGYLDAAYKDGTDCDDTDYDVNPDADEDAYDGIDNDCNPNTADDDLDEDGYDLADDCDDENADVNPRAWDTRGDGLDNNCDGTVDGFRIDEIDVAPGVGYINFSSDYPEMTHGVILFAFLDEETYQSGNDTCPGGGFWWALLTNMENTGAPMWGLVKTDGSSCFHDNLQVANLDNLYLAICAIDDVSLVGEGNRCVAWGGEGTPLAMGSAMNELFDPETVDLYLSDFQRNLLLIGKENTGWTWSDPTKW